MKAPHFAAFVPQLKEDLDWALGRVADLAAEQADEWNCSTCYGSGWRYDPDEGPCHTCGGCGTIRRATPADFHDYD